MKNTDPGRCEMRYLVLSFTNNLACALPFATYVPFLRSHGMSLLEISIINAVFMATIIFLEVPTGSFADCYGRRRSLIISAGLIATGLLSYYFAASFWLFILAELIVGIGRTFASGALEAWAVDAIRPEKKAGLFRRQAYADGAAVLVGSLAGAYAGDHDLALPWLLGACVALIFCFQTTSMQESYHKGARKNFRGQISEALRYGLSSRPLLVLMAAGACLAFCVQAINMQWSVVLKEDHGLRTSSLGWIFCGVALCQMLGGRISAHLRGHWALATSLATTAFLIIIMSQLGAFSAFVSVFMAHEVARGAYKPLKQMMTNEGLPASLRATVLSLDSMLAKVGSFFGLLASGWLAQSLSISFAWMLSGAILAIFALFLLHYNSSRRRQLA